MKAFLKISSIRQSMNSLSGRSLEILFKNEAMKNQTFQYPFLIASPAKTQIEAKKQTTPNPK